MTAGAASVCLCDTVVLVHLSALVDAVNVACMTAVYQTFCCILNILTYQLGNFASLHLTFLALVRTCLLMMEHVSFIAVNSLIIFVIIMPLFSPFRNCSFNYLSFYSYLHSDAIILSLPIHPSAVSSVYLHSLQFVEIGWFCYALF